MEYIAKPYADSYNTSNNKRRRELFEIKLAYYEKKCKENYTIDFRNLFEKILNQESEISYSVISTSPKKSLSILHKILSSKVFKTDFSVKYNFETNKIQIIDLIMPNTIIISFISDKDTLIKKN